MEHKSIESMWRECVMQWKMDFLKNEGKNEKLVVNSGYHWNN